LEARYGDIAAMNEAWGNVFWSQEYRSFEEIDLPNLTVTEPNPSHVLDFYRFSSDQVIGFNRQQTEIIRKYAPGRDIIHNFMGFFFDFDHFALAEDLDAVGWDSYPIGFLDVAPFPASDKERYLRQGHPDIAAFHHDLYRACGRGRWQVLEQQPGAVNWAPHNPAPLAGMVRLWSLEAFAHGGEAVNYFRWRQAPFAQEQMHAGLERPNGAAAPGIAEARETATDLKALALDKDSGGKARVALLFSYEANWLFEAQPQGAEWSYPALVFEWYAGLRRLGLDIDIISPSAPLGGYALILVPSLPIVDEGFIERLRETKAPVLFGPRSGSKTLSLSIPEALAPGLLQTLLPLNVIRSESFPDFYRVKGTLNNAPVEGRAWLDHVETDLAPLARSDEGGLLYRNNNILYLTTVPEPLFLGGLLFSLAEEAGLAPVFLPEDLRRRRRGDTEFVFNYGPESNEILENVAPEDASFILGERQLPPAGVAAWKRNTKSH
ncbi:MAG: beta-galactosidase, partial [Pseudomonadota bacterium]